MVKGKMLLQILLSVLTLSASTNALRILVIYPAPSLSHQRPILALTERLVADGHELFVISPNAVAGLEQHANYTHVDVSFSYKYYYSEKKESDAADLQKEISKFDLLTFLELFSDIPRKQFLSEQFLDFKKRVKVEKIKFDLVITQSFFMPYVEPLARMLTGNAPIITMISFPTDYSAEEALGSFEHLSFVPSTFSTYTNRMSLWEKIENWVSHMYMIYRYKGMLENAAKRYFREAQSPESVKLVEDSWKNISLTLITSNPLYFYPRLLGPNVIEVGPLHLKPPQELPKNLQDWLDGAEKGVVYFSLGSNFRSKSLPKAAISNFLTVFKELPPGYRVLWKWEMDGGIPGQPENVLTQKWIPQQSVLAHPKVRMFITQGGLQSFQEAVHFGVPTLGIPWYGDQRCTVVKMVNAKIGERLTPQDLDYVQKIKSALTKVLFDDSYSRNMRKLSAISHDFTSQALDKAVFWVEHVARHGGAAHLRPATADATLFQYFCLDILAVILATSAAILFGMYYVVKSLLSLLQEKSNPKIKES